MDDLTSSFEDGRVLLGLLHSLNPTEVPYEPKLPLFVSHMTGPDSDSEDNRKISNTHNQCVYAYVSLMYHSPQYH